METDAQGGRDWVMRSRMALDGEVGGKGKENDGNETDGSGLAILAFPA